MIILITGASHTGKTLLAQKLLENLKYPYISIDHLKMGLIRSGETDLTPESDEYLTAYLWPIIKEIIKTAIENHQNMIIEGCYIPFDWRNDFSPEYISEIRFCCLVMTDNYIISHFKDIQDHACDIESRLDDSGLTESYLINENKFYYDGFSKAGEKIILIVSCYEQDINKFTNSLR